MQHRGSTTSPNSSGWSARNANLQHIEYGSLGNGESPGQDGQGFVSTLLRRVSGDRGVGASNQPIAYAHQGGEDIEEEDEEEGSGSGFVRGPSRRESLDLDK